MFIAIATDDFLTFTDNNEAERWTDYTEKTEHPIFTGMTIEEARNRIENYSRYYDSGDSIPEYEVCEITTVAIVKGAYNFNVSCDYLNG